MKTLSYNFFDLKTLHVHSKNDQILEGVDNLFGNFRNDEEKLLPEDEGHIFLEEINEGEWKYQINCSGKNFKIKTLSHLLFRFNCHINQRILAKLPFLFVHASVVARGRDVLVFMGDSGYGKTTISLAMVSQGFKFLSDEYAVIDLAKGKILPYPKGGLVSLESLQLLKKLHKEFDKESVLFPFCEEFIINPWILFPKSQDRRYKYDSIYFFIVFDGFGKEVEISPAPAVIFANSIFYHAKNLPVVYRIFGEKLIDIVFKFAYRIHSFSLKNGKLTDVVAAVNRILEAPEITVDTSKLLLLLQLVKYRLNVVDIKKLIKTQCS